MTKENKVLVGGIDIESFRLYMLSQDNGEIENEIKKLQTNPDRFDINKIFTPSGKIGDK